MRTLRTMRQVSTSKSVKSFRSVPNATGVSMAHLDQARIRLAEARPRQAEERSRWLARQWYEHPDRS